MKTGEWTKSQKQRAALLFERYPILEKAYKHIFHLRGIYTNENREKAKQDLLEWLQNTKEPGIKEFNTIVNTIQDKMKTILNYFIYRNTMPMQTPLILKSNYSERTS